MALRRKCIHQLSLCAKLLAAPAAGPAAAAPGAALRPTLHAGLARHRASSHPFSPQRCRRFASVVAAPPPPPATRAAPAAGSVAATKRAKGKEEAVAADEYGAGAIQVCRCCFCCRRRLRFCPRLCELCSRAGAKRSCLGQPPPVSGLPLLTSHTARAGLVTALNSAPHLAP